ncbi:DUF4184 family protein [Brevibacillus thermoruber]|uniref:DUF4184 family protein n=1 Tax=Brevibacillus thermoruber TaxID=33942 RepID=UPI000416B612|nr:DUF4184 family protein [Brevibacillus thermoruber]
MPFTFAHPAIVLPFWRVRWLSFTALVFGSMAPDFEYFFRLRPYSTVSHSLLGLIVFDLPVALLLAVLFHRIVKRPLVACLPAPFDRGLGYAAAKPWGIGSLRDGLVFSYSAVIGSLTHIVWDAFTHQGGFMVSRLPLLQQRVPVPWTGLDVPVYKMLQHGSTLTGLSLIALTLWLAARRGAAAGGGGRSLPARTKWLYWLGVGGCGLLAAAAWGWSAGGAWPMARLLGGIVPLLSGCMAGLLVMSLLFDRFGPAGAHNRYPAL